MNPIEKMLAYSKHVNSGAEGPPPAERMGTMRTLEAHGYTAQVAVLDGATGLVGIAWHPALPPADLMAAHEAALLAELDQIVMGHRLAPGVETVQ